MTSENLEDFKLAGRRKGGRHVLFAGVAGACVLGAGLGLWARPSMTERQASAVRLIAAPVTPVLRKLQVVVETSPAPLGAPIEVLSKASVQPVRLPPPLPHTPQPLAPVRPPQGLVRVQAVTSLIAPPAVTPLKPAAAKPVARKVAPAAPSHLTAPKLQVAKAKAAATAPIRLAKAAPARGLSKADLARADRAKAAARKIEVAKAAKAAKQQQVRLAQAEARGRAEARAEAKAEARSEALAQARAFTRARIQLARLARAPAHLAPPKAQAKSKGHVAPVQMARDDRKARPHRETRVERASVATRKPPRAAPPVYRAAPAPMAPQPHPNGLMKVSTAAHCGAARPCADPSLGAAERQLARAYQGARAAGVPDAQLQRQQQRWQAARSAATHEAPWAVRDVYLARIAELNGMARDARPDGY